jgi:flavin-dependent dehydrogenase
MLVERSTWPREKVCGCCLNAAGVNELRQLGVLDAAKRVATPLTRVRVRSGARTATLDCLNGLALSRGRLDALLVDEAQHRGVHFACETSAKVIERHHDTWRIHLRRAHSAQARSMDARVVIIADGLNGASLAGRAEFQPLVQTGSRMGVALRADGRSSPLAAGEVHMLIAPHGYVGLVRLDSETIAVAAALEPRWTKSIGGPFAAVERVLSSAGGDAIALDEHSLMGTGLLSRSRPRLAATGLLVIGDAAGYVEPFTGEGMTWALASGTAAGALAAKGLSAWSPAAAESLAREWTLWHARHVQSRHRLCRTVRWCTRHPLATSITLSCLQFGSVARFVARCAARQMHSPYFQQDQLGSQRSGSTIGAPS